MDNGFDFAESYVCGAIALAQSILQNKGNKVPTPDLVLLIDDSIGPNSIIVYKRWWKVHDGMAKELQYYCGDNKEGEMIIRQRVEARNNVDFTL
ncbi:hypothetical protein Lal_00036368 [Lupinus albus]|nr:hypothetical protein Lal_00036368 [Lupinus albus]